MSLSTNSLAAAVGASVKNVQFQPTAEVLPRKILIIGTYDNTLSPVENTPIQILSPEDAATRFGFGFMIHRMAKRVFEGSNGIECWAIAQPDGAGASQAVGSLTVTITGNVVGVYRLYIGAELVAVNVTSTMTSNDLATAVAAAINADNDLPVTAAVNGVTLNQVDVTAKDNARWGNYIDMSDNIGAGEELPSGLAVTYTQLSGGLGTGTIQNALNALGTGDDANQDHFTDVVHGYGIETSVIDAISLYVGLGNDFLGLYDKLVSRPFRAITGDTQAGSAGLAALQVITDARLTDRANGIIAVPGSRTHSSEIAAAAVGNMARISNERPEQSYVGIQLANVDPGDQSDRWTSDYDSRDAAVKSGISPTRVQNGAVYLQNVVSFYRPTTVAVTSNGYRSMRNISILQNILKNIRTTFEQEKWLGISIVQDVAKVSSTVNRQKARDIDAVKDDLTALARAFESKAWIYTAEFTIEKLKEAGAVTIRSGNVGFDAIFSIILSGEGVILDTVAEFDTSIAVLSS